VIIHTARPGVLVGRKGVRVDELKKELQAITGTTCHLTLHEIKKGRPVPVLTQELERNVVHDSPS
jgi:small subunit ribosomal protein S3